MVVFFSGPEGEIGYMSLPDWDKCLMHGKIAPEATWVIRCVPKKRPDNWTAEIKPFT